MNDKVRKRGWSIASTEDGTSSTAFLTDSAKNRKSSIAITRPRADTDYSEDTLTPSQKEELLKYPGMDELDSRVKAIDSCNGISGENNLRSGNDDRVVEKKNDEGRKIIDLKSDDEDDSDSNAGIEMFGDDDKCDLDGSEEKSVIDMVGNDDEENYREQPSKKKKRLNDSNIMDIKIGEIDGNETEKDNLLGKNEGEVTWSQKVEDRKKTLSKWASRLFDPNRLRGLVETPQIIPQNDEFLKQFGERERDFANDTGKPVDIDHSNLDEIDKDDVDENDGYSKDNDVTVSGVKVKITNLSYRTSSETLTLTCEKYGPLIKVHLVMDPKADSKPPQSLGRAYVVFETLEGAEMCITGMNDKMLEGRQLRVSKSDSKDKRRSFTPGGGGGAGKGGVARYWERDITSKCFRCGKVGHMSDQCTNEELPRPCLYCAKVGHDTWSCALSKICYKCGVPGHINRDCPERRHIPKRLVCGICFMSGHDRWQCRERIQNVPSYNALCFVCGERGHFMCKKMQWFFGLTGISCFNCGQAGHHGNECKRPKLYDISRNAELGVAEIERAENRSLLEPLEQKYNGIGHRSSVNYTGRDYDYNTRASNRDNNYRHQYEKPSRATSQPPERFYSTRNQSSLYGRIGQRSNEESYNSSSSGRRGRDYRDESVERLRGRRSESREYRDHGRTSSSRHYAKDPRASRHADLRSDRRGYR